jgi:predicted transcriptional regulator
VAAPSTEDRVPMTFKLPVDTRRRLRIAAAEQDRDMQDIADEALIDWLTRHKF